MAKSIIQRIVTAFDRDASKKAEREIEESLGRAGQKGGDRAGRGFLKELRDEFNKRKAQLSEELAAGTINQKEFKKQTQIAAKTFNAGLLKNIQAARREGTLTDREYTKLARQFKYVGDRGSSAWARIRSGIVRAGAALALYFSARQLARFGADSVRAASEAEARWNRLGGTLRTVGVDFREVEGELRMTARALQDVTTVGDDEFAGTLQKLITTTNDYSLSLANMGNVADVAAATGLDLERAAILVGRALNGETTVLKRYGVELDATRDITEQLAERFGGMAENEAASLQGRLKQINNEWGDFKEAVGLALADTAEGEDVFQRVRDAIKEATVAVEENAPALQALGRGFIEAATFIGGAVIKLGEFVEWMEKADRRMDQFVAKWGATARARRQARDRLRADLRADELANDFGAGGSGGTGDGGAGGTGGGGTGGDGDTGGGAKDPGKTLRARIDLLGKARELNILNGAQIQEILQLEQETRSELEGKNLTLERQIELMERLATLEGMSADLVGQVSAPTLEMADGIVNIHDETAAKVESIWADTHEAIGAEVEGIGRSIGGLFLSWASGGVKGVARFAKAKVLENLAWAAENFAKGMGWIALGNVPSAAAAKGAAVQHLAAAGKWGVVAGAGAAVGSGGSGGGRAASAGPTVTGPRAGIADGAVTAPEINIFIDPLTGQINNPEFQDVVGAAYDRARDTYGNNARINVRPRTGRSV